MVLLLLFSGYKQELSGDPTKLKKIMDSLLPSGSLVWEVWKEIIIERLTKELPLRFEGTHWNHRDLTSESDRVLLETLLKGAQTAYDAFINNRLTHTFALLVVLIDTANYQNATSTQSSAPMQTLDCFALGKTESLIRGCCVILKRLHRSGKPVNELFA
ncbi:hypothetical protein M404DRAFT_25189 [Pisolithus tinctorius Marx 270]|uniref:Uncharacterized protein n=1 Tax=Pisolithus tinctorius Marx 270 TaxID=870435 RepID=A0A0C3NYQ0_PISTI|nr:hypothetical protein M404DRAFT_25189 [Pisolithus tinctorius Marx 270]